MSVRRDITSPSKGEVGAKRRVGVGPTFTRTRTVTARARRLRHEMTDAERKLWQALRARQLEGFEFRRQHPVGRYTLDFYCPVLKLAVEVDGGQHGSDVGRAADEKRTAWLETRGITVLRVWNSDVLDNLEGVFLHIRNAALSRQAERGTPTPALPLAGGGSKREVDR